MSLVHNMIGSGAAGEAFASIGVTYPSGSVCTCTKGSKVLTAKGTSGSYIFLVPEAGTWVVSCSGGGQTRTKSVTITEQYQLINVNLDKIVLYKLGNEYSDITGGYGSSGYTAGGGHAVTSGTKESQDLKLQGGNDAIQLFGTANAINIAGYSTLKANVNIVSCVGSEGHGLHLCIGAKTNAISTVEELRTGSHTMSLDLSGITGTQYVYAWMGWNTSNVSTISEIWLE